MQRKGGDFFSLSKRSEKMKTKFRRLFIPGVILACAVLMMLLCRHKIKKTAFMIPFLLVVLIQAAALYYAWSRGWFSPDRPSGGG